MGVAGGGGRCAGDGSGGGGLAASLRQAVEALAAVRGECGGGACCSLQVWRICCRRRLRRWAMVWVCG